MARDRIATIEDVPVLVRVINAAYLVEQFFIRGDRTSVEEVEGLIRATDGAFLVLETPSGEITGCVHAKVDRGRGYLGLDLDVFNVRPELPPFYASLGFEAQSEAAFEKQELLLQPAHLIRMTKPLGSPR